MKTPTVRKSARNMVRTLARGQVNMVVLFGAIFGVGLFLGVGVLLIVLTRGLNSGARDPYVAIAGEDAPAFASMTIPEFELIDHNGSAVTQEDLEEGVTILDFMFTHCPLVCPTMTGNMSTLTQSLAGTAVRFRSVSVDPLRDTPEVLREYAKMYSADLDRWHFWTGDAQTVRRLAYEGFRLGMSDDPSFTIPLGDGTSMNNILHPVRFILIGPGGRVVKMYDGTDDESVALLARDARIVLRHVERNAKD